MDKKDYKIDNTSNSINWNDHFNQPLIMCPYRLPCGLCEKTMQKCPMMTSDWTVVWKNYSKGE